MNELLDWIQIHEDKLKIASLIVALLVFLTAVYRWLLQRWRADVSLRQYAYVHPIAKNELIELTEVKIDVPAGQELKLELHSLKEESQLFKGHVEAGLFELTIDMRGKEPGTYSLRLLTADQTIIKKLHWSG